MSSYTCPECGRRLRKVRDFSGHWDGESYVCDYCAANSADDIPEGCSACGGPYPDCKYSCPLFDE